MLDWFWMAAERFRRSNPRRLARRLTRVPARFVRRVARAKLVYLLRYVYRHSIAQRRRWEEAGIRLSDLRSPDVLTRIPFCDGGQVARNPEDFFCVPEEKLTHVITTSGTTGTAKKIFFTNEDLAYQTRMMGTNLCGLPGASRVLIMYRIFDPTWAVGAFTERGVEQAEMFCLRSGNHLSADEQIRLIREYRIDSLITTPSYAHRVTLEAKQDLHGLGVRYILLGGQSWSENLRATLEQAWGATALDAWGCNECGTGIAAECTRKNGLHLSEADFWIEIVDPATGAPVPDGEEGEVVVTTLSRRGMPLVRYRIGDLAHLMPREDRCECGSPLRRLSRIKGRMDDILFIGNGVHVYPDEIDRAVLGSRGVTDYQLTIERDGYQDMLHLTVESALGGPAGALEDGIRLALRKVEAIREAVDETKMAGFGRFQVVPMGTLSQNRVKSVRIVDKRE